MIIFIHNLSTPALVRLSNLACPTNTKFYYLYRMITIFNKFYCSKYYNQL